MSKKSWECKEYDTCKSYNPEYQVGACSLYPCQKQKKTEESSIEAYDTS